MILATILVIWGCWRIKKWDYKKCSLNFAMIIPFPVIPGNNNVSFPFPKFGNGISIPVPVPKKWEWNFHSRSRSQKLGMQFFIPVPVPKVWEWVEPFPFPFPNVKKSFPLTPVIQVLKFWICCFSSSDASFLVEIKFSAKYLVDL